MNMFISVTRYSSGSSDLLVMLFPGMDMRTMPWHSLSIVPVLLHAAAAAMHIAAATVRSVIVILKIDFIFFKFFPWQYIASYLYHGRVGNDVRIGCPASRDSYVVYVAAVP